MRSFEVVVGRMTRLNNSANILSRRPGEMHGVVAADRLTVIGVARAAEARPGSAPWAGRTVRGRHTGHAEWIVEHRYGVALQRG